MEKAPKINVKIVSKEAVKPSIPTASHRKTFNMCYLDQMLPLNPPFLTSGLLFYTNNNNAIQKESHVETTLTRLKTSLSKTLTSFYPLAGRVQQSTIQCNDHGIPFFEAHVNCPLSPVLNSPQKLDLVSKFLPPRDSLGVCVSDDEEGELIHLAIQFSIFTCGGVAIGWYDIHKIMDGTSSVTFFKHWAALAGEQFWHDDGCKPDFNAPVSAFPPSPKTELLKLVLDLPNSRPPSVVVKSFVFGNHSISQLKAMGSSHKVPHPSRYLALAGFIWQQLISILMVHSQYDNHHTTNIDAIQNHQHPDTDTDTSTDTETDIDTVQNYRQINIDTDTVQKNQQADDTDTEIDQHHQLIGTNTVKQYDQHMDTILQVPIDMRPFTNPPLSKSSIGNLIHMAVARAETCATLPELVERLYGAIAKMKDEIRECYHGEKGGKAVRASWDKLITTLSEYDERAYKVVSWCKLGFNDLDSGFGKPDWFIPTDGIMSPFHKNLIILTDNFNDDGIQAWFFLEEKHMELLESNSRFLAFASPLY